MNKIFLVILAPTFFGCVLLLLVLFNLFHFHSNSVGVQTMLGRELPIVLLGFTSSLVIAVMAVFWLIKKQWLKALYSALSILVFFVSFFVAGIHGGAFINAT